jgi:hypothetical protein
MVGEEFYRCSWVFPSFLTGRGPAAILLARRSGDQETEPLSPEFLYEEVTPCPKEVAREIRRKP